MNKPGTLCLVRQEADGWFLCFEDRGIFISEAKVCRFSSRAVDFSVTLAHPVTVSLCFGRTTMGEALKYFQAVGASPELLEVNRNRRCLGCDIESDS